MSKKKQGGKASQHVSPAGKRLGIKVTHGQKVKSGSILIRQRGTKYRAANNVGVGRDHSLFAKVSGLAKFKLSHGKVTLTVEEN